MSAITYLWIALGGALGSVLRAWVGFAMARLTGPQFPWGTILINVIGSFVIGCFGTLTSPDGRFGVAPDARIFVMVGVCGGFTTFSSFSLQTLDLLRDGRPGQALGNVFLSVLLCLAAVAAGHASAASLNARVALMPQERGAITPEGPVALGETALVLLEDPGAAPGLLGAAERLVRLRDCARIETRVCVPARQAALLPTEDVQTLDHETALRAEQEDWRGRLAALGDEWLARARTAGIAASWGGAVTDPAAMPQTAAFAAEGDGTVVVLAASGPRSSHHSRALMHAALFADRHPVLAVPAGAGAEFGRVVAIAWRQDESAERAVAAALPILRRAAQVHVLCALARDEKMPDLPGPLVRSAIAAKLHRLAMADDAGETLLRGAAALGADLLVMGAYTHGEWREALLGGVTRTLLATAPMPLLLRH